MSGITRLGFVEVQVNDLSQANNFYSQILGLQETQKEDGKLCFKCWDEYDHHSVVLRKAGCPGLVKIGWKVESARDLEQLEKKIEVYGIKSTRISKNEEVAVARQFLLLPPQASQ